MRKRLFLFFMLSAVLGVASIFAQELTMADVSAAHST